MKEIKLVFSEDILICDEQLTKICEYLKTNMGEWLSQMFPHLYSREQGTIPLSPMIRFYPTGTEHVLKPLGEFVDYITEQIEGYDHTTPLIFTRCLLVEPQQFIAVFLPKIGTGDNEVFIYRYDRDINPISKLKDYYGSLKQGDDKMIALVYMKALDGVVISEILPYEVKYYRDDEYPINGRSSIEFIDVFTNKKCIFEFKGDEIMGVNIKDNTSEGAAFEQALAFANKNKKKDTQISDTGVDTSVGVIDILTLQEAKADHENYTACMNLLNKMALNDKKNHKLKVHPKKIDTSKCVPTSTESEVTRPSKICYYLDIAKAVAQRGTCLRRKFGAIIVKYDRIVSTGYAGAPHGRINCCDRGKCFRKENNIPAGTRYELCRSIHAEMNAIISASKEEMEGATMYLVGIENDGSYTEADCCSMCKRVIINAGIKTVVFRTKDGGARQIDVDEWINNDDSLYIHDNY